MAEQDAELEIFITGQGGYAILQMSLYFAKYLKHQHYAGVQSMVTNHSQDTLDLVVEVVHCVGIALSLSILTEATLWLAQAIIVTIYRVLNKFNVG